VGLPPEIGDDRSTLLAKKDPDSGAWLRRLDGLVDSVRRRGSDTHPSGNCRARFDPFAHGNYRADQRTRYRDGSRTYPYCPAPFDAFAAGRQPGSHAWPDPYPSGRGAGT
jgi:hypothetical protein